MKRPVPPRRFRTKKAPPAFPPLAGLLTSGSGRLGRLDEDRPGAIADTRPVPPPENGSSFAKTTKPKSVGRPIQPYRSALAKFVSSLRDMDRAGRQRPYPLTPQHGIHHHPAHPIAKHRISLDSLADRIEARGIELIAAENRLPISIRLLLDRGALCR